MNYSIFGPEELIEEGLVEVPLSKSVANRALVLAAMTPGAPSPVCPDCADTAVMRRALDALAGAGSDEVEINVDNCGTAMRFLKEGDKLLMFPEGTRVKEGEVSDAQTGAAMLALRTGVPIVPIWMPAKKKWFRRTPVVFGEAYYPEMPEGAKPTNEDYRRVADDLLARIMALGAQHGN